MIIDSHCHLNFPEFADDFKQILERAKQNNVQIMQTICTQVSKFPDVLAIANAYQNIYCSTGVHPCDVEKEGIISIKNLLDMTRNDKVISLGETGIDFYHTIEQNKRDKQIESFINHIEAAKISNLPLIIHTRDAEEVTIKILKEQLKLAKFKAVIHCFTGSSYMAKEILDMGFYISISGIVTFKNATNLQNIVKNLPLDKLLVETDAPYLAPIPHRGKRNEPAYVKHTAEFIAKLKNISYDEVAKATTDNFFKLFDKCII